MMSKPYINLKPTKIVSSIAMKFLALSLLTSFQVLALDSDKTADFILQGDNFVNLPEVKGGVSKIKYWDNITIEQGTLKIKADEAIIYNDKDGISKVELTGTPVDMEQFIDSEFGKLEVQAQKVDFLINKDLLIMTKDVHIKSKIQGEMTGEKITMNLKSKEIKGEKAENKRVKLILKPKSKSN